MSKLKSITLALALLLLSSLFTGCASHMKIAYNMDDIQVQKNEDLSKYTLDIQVFEDVRDSLEENKTWFESDKQTGIEGKSYCINAEKNYEKGTVNAQVSQNIAKHLKKRGAFKDVTFNQKEKADYYLVGKIKKMAGKREYSQAAATTSAVSMQMGAIGGLIGGLMIANMKTPGSTEIEFSEILLYSKDSEEPLAIQNVGGKKEKEIQADGYCWSIYWEVNNDLKLAIDQLANGVETAILNARTEAATAGQQL